MTFVTVVTEVTVVREKKTFFFTKKLFLPKNFYFTQKKFQQKKFHQQIQNVTKLKTPNVTKLKNSKCDKIQKFLNVTKLKNSKCDKTKNVITQQLKMCRN